MTRVLLAVLFLGIGVGAVVYSVVISEKGESSSTIPFSLLRSQHCDDDGVYTIEYANHSCTDGQLCVNSSVIIEQPLKWKQNNEGKELELIFDGGLKYVRISNVTITRDEKNHTCTEDFEQNYDKFISNLCMDRLQRNTSEESIKIDGVEVYRYYGIGSCKINGFNVWIEAFSRIVDDTVYGWVVRFEEASPLVRMKYWFPTMKNGSISLDLEKSC